MQPPSDPRRVLPARLPRPGEVFARCVIEGEIARGGAGAVFRVRGPDGQPYALKVLLGDMRRQDRRERFLREAEVGRRLKHPGIVRVLDHGQENDLPFLVMELLDGARPLDRYVAERQVALRERVQLLVHVAEAIQAAHDEGLIHRDLKPDNVLVTPAGEVKVVDFGLARHLDQERMTQSGAVMGTLQYMAPEQVRGDTAHADARTDVFALGVMLYQLASEELPFDGETGMEIMRAICERTPRDLRATASDSGIDDPLLGGLGAIASMALAKAPEQRYPTAAAFARDLVALLSGSAATSAAQRQRGRRLRKAGALGASAVLLAVVGFLGVYLWQQRAPEPLAAEVQRQRAGALQQRGLALAKGPTAPFSQDAAAIEGLRKEVELLVTEAGAGIDEKVRRAERTSVALSGLLAMSRADREGAAQALEQLGEHDSPLRAALRGALAVETAEGDPAEAIKDLTRAVGHGVTRCELRGWRAQARVRAGLSSEAQANEVLAELALVAKARGGGLSPGELSARVRALLVAGRVEQATQLLAGIPAPPAGLREELAVARGSNRIDEGKYGEALRELLPLRPTKTPSPARKALAERCLKLLGPVLLRTTPGNLGREAKAKVLALCRIARRLDPPRPLPMSIRRTLLMHVNTFRKRPDLALGLAVVELAPNDLTVLKAVGKLGYGGFSKGDRRCLAVIRRAIELETDLAEKLGLQVFQCRMLAAANDRWSSTIDKNECRELVRLATYLEPRIEGKDLAEALACRSRGLRLLGDLEGSLRDIERAIELQRADDTYLHARMLTLRGLKLYKRAFDDAAQFARTHPDSDLASVFLVWDLYARLREAQRARKVLEDLLTKRKRYADWWVRVALVQLDCSAPQAAARSLRTAARIYTGRKKSWDAKLALQSRRVADLLPGRRSEARALLRRVVARIEALPRSKNRHRLRPSD